MCLWVLVARVGCSIVIVRSAAMKDFRRACIGSMVVVGALEDSALGDIITSITRAILDFVIILDMACSLGRGCGFSTIPVGVLQGPVTEPPALIRPLMTEPALRGFRLWAASSSSA